MYLSMYLIADWLKEYEPDCHIKNGSMILRNVRVLSEFNTFRPDSVYIGKAKDFIPTIDESVICVNGDDYLIIRNQDTDLIFNKVMHVFDYYNHWEEEINHKIMTGCTIQDLVDCSEDIFQNPIAVVNSSHMTLAISSDQYAGHLQPEAQYLREHKFMPLELIMEFNEALKGTMGSTEPYYFKSPTITYTSVQQNVFFNQKHIGWMLIPIAHPRYARTLPQLCNAFVQKLNMWRTVNGELDSFSQQSDLFIRLLENSITNKAEVWNQLHCLGWSEEDEKYLIQIEVSEDMRFLYKILVYQYTQTFSNCYIFPYQSSLLMVCNTKTAPMEHLLKEIAPALKQCHACCGVSYPFKDVFLIREAFTQAGIALLYGRRNATLRNRCEDFAVQYAMHVLKEHLDVTISHPALWRIREYDKANGTEYEKTLFVYLQNERNQTITAKKLHVHKNTLIYRVDRLSTLFGLDLDDYKLREHLMISLLLEQV